MTLSHLSTESMVDCPKCSGADSLIKVLTAFATAPKKETSPKKVGDVTEEFIETSRRELRSQREELVKKR